MHPYWRDAMLCIIVSILTKESSWISAAWCLLGCAFFVLSAIHYSRDRRDK